MKSGRVIFLLAIGVAIIAAGAYYFGLFSPPPTAVAPQPNVAETAPKTEPAAPAETPKAAEAQKGDKNEVSAPAFDVVRVEPSGDMVIAGTAAPDSAVEIVTGSNVIANAKADSAGNFAAVLDKPLKPGDYQIVLRATSPDGTVATSTQTAVVSVPADNSGQVLALVEQPGEPSRLITKPEATEEAKTGSAAGQETGEAANTGADGEKEGKQSRDGSDTAGSTATDKASDTAAGSAGEVASAEPQASSNGAAANSEYSVSVEAVEIDGGKVFVAGTGKPGLPIMIYANDTLLGQVKVSPVGRFLLETERDLPVGDYIIRADMLDETGAKVLARAAVPFEREAGESVAAVAPSANDAKIGGQANDSADQGGSIEHSHMGSEIANSPPTIVGEKLSNVKSSVIIRRGDNLWRISRRVYGRGVRYTTIYLANKDQIRDPDMIWPGQVFAVPRETPEGEKADTKELEKRWVEQGKKPAENQQ